ncbi:MAG: hypothetical protein II872_06590, partial [Clostridia bacterium]|nr:hypothetical protein [Clostridia bacterium]
DALYSFQGAFPPPLLRDSFVSIPHPLHFVNTFFHFFGTFFRPFFQALISASEARTPLILLLFFAVVNTFFSYIFRRMHPFRNVG